MDHFSLYGKDQIGICKDHERILEFADCILLYGYAIKSENIIKDMNKFIDNCLTKLLSDNLNDGCLVLDTKRDYGMFKNKIQLNKILLESVV
jgi:hypothetical protein